MRNRLLCLVFLAALAAWGLFFSEHSVRYPEGGWDAWAIWNWRARMIHRAGDFAPAVSTQHHPDYPPLVPALVAGLWRATGGESRWAPVLVAGAFALLAAAALVLALERLRGRPAALLAGAVLLSTPAFVTFTWNQYADGPLAAFVAVGAALVAIGVEGAARWPLLAAGVALSLGAWTKNEGLVYLVAFAIGAGVVARRRAAWLALGAAPGLALLAIYKANAPASEMAAAMTSVGFAPARLWVLAVETARELIAFERWGVALMVAPVALLWSWRSPRRPGARALGIALAAAALGVGWTYLHTPYDLRWQLQSSLGRVILQLWPAALMLVFVALPQNSIDGQPPSKRSSLLSSEHS